MDVHNVIVVANIVVVVVVVFDVHVYNVNVVADVDNGNDVDFVDNYVVNAVNVNVVALVFFICYGAFCSHHDWRRYYLFEITRQRF